MSRFVEQERWKRFPWDFLAPSFQSEERSPLLRTVLGEDMVQGQLTPQPALCSRSCYGRQGLPGPKVQAGQC